MSDLHKAECAFVSVITAVYNSEHYVSETIESVMAQTYKEWELLLVDDCSTDNSAAIIKKYAEQDARIRYIRLEVNSGAAIARNTALQEARGRYIAYLDADDLWCPEKLEHQIEFMNHNRVSFSCCDYEKIEDNGTTSHKIVHMPKTVTYEQLLCNTVIQTSGVIVDTKYVDRKLLIMPNVRRGQDSATWLQMLRNGVEFYGQNEVLAKYRRTQASLSSNKFKAMRRTWYIYRGLEKLSLAKSIWCMICWAYHASIRRVYVEKYFQ